MVPASSARTNATATATVRQAVGGVALALVLAAGLAACGGKEDSATDAGSSSSAPASTAVPATGSSSASSSSAPASGGSATTAPAGGVTASTAADAAFDTVPEAEVAEMERTLDEIDQMLNDLDTDFTQDQD